MRRITSASGEPVGSSRNRRRLAVMLATALFFNTDGLRMPDPSDPSPATLTLRGDHITLAQAVKVVGLADTGGQAKLLVREGGFTVNGVAETQPGRKLRVG